MVQAPRRPPLRWAGTATASKSPIKIGFVTSLTGNASSTFSNSATGAKAYFDAVNKQGGYNGHPIELVTEDDTSSTTGAASATKLLISQGVFAIISDSSYFFGGNKSAQQAGIPVIGSGFDGPEWGQQPNTNMFSFGGGRRPQPRRDSGRLSRAATLSKSLGVRTSVRWPMGSRRRPPRRSRI